MRRKDLEVTDSAEIFDIIDRCSILHIGINDSPAPYIVPVNFGYTAGGGNITFYFHTADADTRKTRLLARNPVVSFEAECDVEIIKRKSSCSCTTAYSSIMGIGKAEIIIGDESRREALDCIMFCNGFKGVPEYPEDVFKRAALYKITVSEISAKCRSHR